ncbi:MAG TPA: HlyD family efflux transporter periplasmic adaptor subunit, partial [candidate division WOR-3 bacterium]|nr:HlyD family efflux transporter periplasmic adaptor subunit [candidate division WOR-3 bacterium]
EVVGVNKEEGEMAVVGTINTPGSVIMTIADLSKMMVKAYIDESEVVKIKKGNKARIKIDAYPGKVFTGKVISVGGIPQQSTGQEYGISYPVEILINDTAYLLPGMSASCEIITGESSNALRVPIVALGKEKGSNKDYCFVVKSRVAKKRYVKTGIEGEVYIEALGGVEEGDTVITGPFEIQRKLKDGDRVSVTLKEKKQPGKN